MKKLAKNLYEMISETSKKSRKYIDKVTKSLDPFHIASYYISRVNTSWTYSTKLFNFFLRNWEWQKSRKKGKEAEREIESLRRHGRFTETRKRENLYKKVLNLLER